MGNLDIRSNAKGQKLVMDPCTEPCPIERGMRLIGGKWTGSILWHLQDGPIRFNDLARQLGGASKKIVTQRLKEMEKNKLVQRNVISSKPVAVAYEITDFGRTTLDFLGVLKDWTTEHNL